MLHAPVPVPVSLCCTACLDRFPTPAHQYIVQPSNEPCWCGAEAGDGVTCTVLGPVSAEGCEQLQPWLQPHCQPGMLGVRVWPATPDSFVSLLPELVAASPAPEHVPVGSRSGFLRSSGGDNAWTAHLRARRLLQ